MSNINTNLKVKSSLVIRFLRQLYILNRSSYRRNRLRIYQKKKPIFKRIKSQPKSQNKKRRKFDIWVKIESRNFRVFQNFKRNTEKLFSPRIKKVKKAIYKPLSRRSYKRAKFLRTKFARYRYKAGHGYAFRKVQRRYPLIRSANVHIKLRRRNAFLTCTSRRKRTLFTLSTGTFHYVGRKKATLFARERLARKVAQRLFKNHYRLVDIYFVSKMGRFYRAIVKAAISSGLIIRMLKIVRTHSHSWVRPKKAKRK